MNEIEKNKEIMLNKKTWAVIGANNNPSKYGNKIFKLLKRKGYEVYPVNPKYDEVEGDKCYASLSDLPKKVEAISVVVPPSIAIANLDEASKLGIEYMWFQPGTFDERVLNKSEELKMKVVYYDCVLVALS